MKKFRNSNGWIVPNGDKKLIEYAKNLDPEEIFDFIDEDETTREIWT